jgi:hypothetical protein
VLLPGAEVASCVRQGTTREVAAHRARRDGVDRGARLPARRSGRDFYLQINAAESAKRVFEIQAPLRRPGDQVPEVVPRRLRASHAV